MMLADPLAKELRTPSLLEEIDAVLASPTAS